MSVGINVKALHRSRDVGSRITVNRERYGLLEEFPSIRLPPMRGCVENSLPSGALNNRGYDSDGNEEQGVKSTDGRLVDGDRRGKRSKNGFKVVNDRGCLGL